MTAKICKLERPDITSDLQKRRLATIGRLQIIAEVWDWWLEWQVRVCLVINKMDRLIQELGLTPMEAYARLRGIITHVNMILSAFQSEQHISEADAVLAHEDAKASFDDRSGRPGSSFRV
jgi:translation elongation factor EF-G